MPALQWQRQEQFRASLHYISEFSTTDTVCLPHPHTVLGGWQTRQLLCRTHVFTFFIII